MAAAWAAIASERGPLMPFIDGPFSAAARRDVALWMLRSPDLPPGTQRWRAYRRFDYDWQGDYDAWFRLDGASDAEIATMLDADPKEARSQPPACATPWEFIEGPKRWWPADNGQLRLLDARGGQAIGSCLWLDDGLDDGGRRAYLYAWKF